MASTIQIKRGTGSAVPTGLADGELAINLDNGQLYFGSGSNSINSFKFTNLTVNELTSSIVTSSIIFSSGSNIFGDDSSDTHLFRGNITASGNISSSGTIIGNSIVGNLTGNADTATTLTAGNKILDGNLTIGGDQAGHDFILYGDTQYAKFHWDASQDYLKLSDQAKIVFGSGANPVDFDSSIQADGTSLVIYNDTGDVHIGDTVIVTGSLEVTTNLTASGDISSSGNITTTEITASSILTTGNAEIGGTLFAARIHPNGSSGPFIDQANDDLQFSTGIKTLSHITASGNISASGTVFTDTISSPTNNLVVSSSTVTITSTTAGEANLILEADTDNNDENDNPFMSFKQDGGVIEGQIGLSGDADKWPDGTPLTGVTPNAMVIGMTGSSSSTNRQLYLAAGNTASLEIKNDADVHIMNGNLNLDGTNALYGGGHLIAKFDSEIIIGAGNRPLELNSTTTEINGRPTFTGAITASSDISASGNIFGAILNLDHSTEAIINMYQAGTQRVKISGRAGQDSYFNAGDVAIGTDTPAEKLTVEGNISASGTIQFSGTDTSEDATHYIEFKKPGNTVSNVTNGVSINPSSDTLVLGGTTTIAGQAGTITGLTSLTSTNITASGNISSSGTITADRFLGSQLTMVPFNYFVSSQHSSELYIPQGGSQVEGTSDQPYHFMLAPYDGKVRRLSVYYQTGDPGDLTARVRKAAAPFDLDDSDDIIQAETISSTVDDTAYFFDFSASFSKGDAVAVTLEAASHATNCYVVGSISVEYDTTT